MSVIDLLSDESTLFVGVLAVIGLISIFIVALGSLISIGENIHNRTKEIEQLKKDVEELRGDELKWKN